MTETEILDIGCGNNPIDGAVGVDIRDYPNVDHQADARDLPFADNRFDRANASQLLEHLSGEEIADVLEEVSRVLKPGGILQFDVPYARAYKDDPTHKTRWYFKTIAYYLPRDEVARLGWDPEIFPDYYADHDLDFELVERDATAWLDVLSPPLRPLSFTVRQVSRFVTTDRWDGLPLIGGLVAGNLVFQLRKREER